MKKMLFSVLLGVLTTLGFGQMQKKTASVQLIRNATLTLTYAGHKILVDPMLSPKGSFPSITGKAKNPTVDLPTSISKITKDVDLVLITHTHFDHFDAEAVKHLDKSVKLMNQAADQDTIRKMGFTNSETINDQLTWNTIRITRTRAEHGTGRVLERMGNASGFILQAENQPTIYIIGDAVWTEEIYLTIKNYQPDYIIVNSGGAKIPGMDATPILMDELQTMSVVQESGTAKVIAVHMNALDHCHTTRNILKNQAKKQGIGTDKLIIPNDGETIVLK